MTLYPINLNICDQLCVVVGGGSVAARKVESLLACGAEVRVVSPVVCAEIRAFLSKGRLELIRREYKQGDLAGSILAFAATDVPAVQKAVIREAKKLSILVNVADKPESCSFQVPATLRRGELLMTVSTGGGSPLLASVIRKRLEAEYGVEYGALVKLLGMIRKQLLDIKRTEINVKPLFEKLLSSNMLVYIRSREWREIKELLKQELPEQVDIDAVIGEMIKEFEVP